MEFVISFVVAFVYTAVLWAIVLGIYNFAIEAFDFGPLPWFVGKSALLIFVVALCLQVPGGILLSFAVWWVGLVLVFQKDFWECRVLVILLWGVNVVFGLLVQYLLHAAFMTHPAA